MSANAPRIGETIDQYTITGQLGEGGMGVVYLAEDTTLGRKVALKFLPSWANSDEDAKRRFIHEAKTSSVLDHPNIATIHDVKTADNGDLFIVMGYYDGRTIRDYLNEDDHLSIEDAIDFASQTASGLDAAHEEGIIHRDIKPGNVIVTPKGRAVILDFGLAKVEDVTMTQDGTSMGTMAYMSPEQAKNESLDGRTDLWALGVMLYEMLAGKRPFDGGYEAAILYAAAHEPHTTVQLHRSDAPDWLSDVIDKLLEKRPDDRFQSAGDVVEALANKGAVETPADTPAEVGSKPENPTPTAEPGLNTQSQILIDPTTGAFVTRDGTPIGPLSGAQMLQSGLFQPPPPTKSKALLWGGAAVAVIVIVVVGWLVGQSMRGDSSGQITEAQQARARELNRTALEYRANRQFTLAQATAEEALTLDSTYSEAWTTLAAIDIGLEDYDAAVQHAQRAIRLDESNVAGWFNLAFASEELGRFGEALGAYEASVKADSSFIPGYSAWGNRLIESGQPAEALSVLQRGFSVAPNDPRRFLLFKNIGKAHLAMGNPESAVGPLEESVRLNDTHWESLSLLTDAYEALGRTEDAQEILKLYVGAERDAGRRAAAEARLN
jgi:serine/threonine protein kinase/Tfp pilus assembly protein PilF